MKKLNLNVPFYDAVEYDMEMSDKELILQSKKELQFELEEIQDKYKEIKKNNFRITTTVRNELRQLKEQIINIKASLFHKNWN